MTVLSSTPPQGQPHTVFGEPNSISGGWILLYKELQKTVPTQLCGVQYISVAYLGVLVGVSVLHTVSSKMFLFSLHETLNHFLH